MKKIILVFFILSFFSASFASDYSYKTGVKNWKPSQNQNNITDTDDLKNSDNENYGWNYSYSKGRYYKTGNTSFYRSSNERGNEVIDKENRTEFLGDDGNGYDLDNDFILSSRTSSTDMLASGTSGAVQNIKFYTHELKLSKEINDKFELYGGTVLGASPYVLNNVGGVYDANDRVGAFASTRGGARYHATNDIGLVLESQYNLTGQLADNTGMFDGFNGAQYKGSTLVKTGFEWTF